jgi:hypothetical protein
MENEIDGGVFSEIRKEELKKQANNNNGQKENENQFITGDPSMITTDEVFALLGEQMVKAKNWAKIALAWNKNFNTLKQSITQKEFQTASMGKQNQELKSSNDKFIIINQTLDKRITELNLQAKEKDNKIHLAEKSYEVLETKYNQLENTNNELNIDIKNLLGDIEKLKAFIDESDKENTILKEKITTKGKKTKKPKA